MILQYSVGWFRYLQNQQKRLGLATGQKLEPLGIEFRQRRVHLQLVLLPRVKTNTDPLGRVGSFHDNGNIMGINSMMRLW